MRPVPLILFILLAWLPAWAQQPVRELKLKQQRMEAPLHFHITAIKDERKDTTNGIGFLKLGIGGKQETKVDLQGGVRNALSNYIQNNLRQNLSTDGVELRITKLHVYEKNGKQDGGTAQFDANSSRERSTVDMGIAFYLGDNKLIEYEGTAYAENNFDASGYAEKLIRQNLEGAIHNFDGWWPDHKAEATAKPSVQISVSIVADADSEQIAYERERPLEQEDFAGDVDDLSKAAAATYSIMAMKYSSESLNGHVQVKVMLSATFDKTKSWWKKDNNNKNALVHEQGHFDIAAVNTCELAERIKNGTFTVENYAKELEAIHKKVEKEREQMDKDYDKQTNHGTIKAEQLRWTNELAEQLAKRECL